jgi:hypothetical protein
MAQTVSFSPMSALGSLFQKYVDFSLAPCNALKHYYSQVRNTDVLWLVTLSIVSVDVT